MRNIKIAVALIQVLGMAFLRYVYYIQLIKRNHTYVTIIMYTLGKILGVPGGSNCNGATLYMCTHAHSAYCNSLMKIPKITTLSSDMRMDPLRNTCIAYQKYCQTKVR